MPIIRAILVQCFRAYAAVPKLGPANRVNRLLFKASHGAACMAERRDQVLRVAIKMRLNMGSIRKKPKPNADRSPS